MRQGGGSSPMRIVASSISIVLETYAARLAVSTIEADGSLAHRRVWAQDDERLCMPVT
jgi:hypothetical protein